MAVPEGASNARLIAFLAAGVTVVIAVFVYLLNGGGPQNFRYEVFGTIVGLLVFMIFAAADGLPWIRVRISDLRSERRIRSFRNFVEELVLVWQNVNQTFGAGSNRVNSVNMASMEIQLGIQNLQDRQERLTETLVAEWRSSAEVWNSAGILVWHVLQTAGRKHTLLFTSALDSLAVYVRTTALTMNRMVRQARREGVARLPQHSRDLWTNFREEANTLVNRVVQLLEYSNQTFGSPTNIYIERILPLAE